MSAVNYWLVIPAAGIGSRMLSAIPKQYLDLCGESIINTSLKRLMSIPQLHTAVVALSAQDTWWNPPSSLNILTTLGGNERFESVLNALHFLDDKAQPDDWVLVHDAVRPCVRRDKVMHLMESLKEDDVGGILAVPVNDTLKKAVDFRIQKTQNRANLWRAQTPQMFRYQRLKDSLQQTSQRNIAITDEASALEQCGFSVKIIQGSEDNIKITRPEDLALATLFIQHQTNN